MVSCDIFWIRLSCPSAGWQQRVSIWYMDVQVLRRAGNSTPVFLLISLGNGGFLEGRDFG